MTELVVCAVQIAMTCMMGVLALVLVRRGVIKAETVTETRELLEGMQVEGGGFVSRLVQYAAIAVRVVEQAVKNGELEKDNMARKMEAVSIVQELASVDGVDMSDVTGQLIGDLIDSEVSRLPHNH